MWPAELKKLLRVRNHITGAVLSIFATSANAQTTGNALYEWCSSSDEVYQALCSVYIEAAMQGERTGAIGAGLRYFNIVSMDVSDSKFEELKSLKLSALLGYCIPDEATGQQTKDIVLKYLEGQPEKRHEAAETLVHSSLSKALPCLK